MRKVGTIIGALLGCCAISLASGCNLVTKASAPAINISQLQINPVQDGKVTITGMPGTMLDANRLSISIHRIATGDATDKASDGHLNLVTTTANVESDGSVRAITLEGKSGTLQAGDELLLVPSMLYLGNPRLPSHRDGATVTMTIK